MVRMFGVLHSNIVPPRSWVGPESVAAHPARVIRPA